MDFLNYEFMQRALVAAALVGLAAPTVGVHLVQRRLALIGDGIGHVALAGVAIGLVTSTAPVLTALICATAGAVAIEVIRSRGRTSGDVALAIMFYGGIAAGVVIISQAPGGTPGNLNAYLFGAITTTTRGDLVAFALLTVFVLAITLGFSRYLFAVSNDEEYARATGMPVLTFNILLAVVTALTVVVAMRVVGLLLISALMIVPVATARLVARSFRATIVIAILLAVTASVSGVVTSYYTDTPSGGTIVLFAVGVFLLTAGSSATMARVRRERPNAA